MHGELEGVLCKDLVEPWLTDWRGRYTGKAVGLASPVSTDEVSRFVKLCSAHGVPIVPQGGNSGMSGGATPDDGGDSVILSALQLHRCFDGAGSWFGVKF